MNEFDTRGRAIAQAFWSEMEKIAYSRAARSLTDQAAEAARRHSRVAKSSGLMKWVPFTDAHRATDAARIRARDARSAAEKKIKSERSAAFRAIRTGKGNQEAALRIIEGKPKRRKPRGGGIATPDLPDTSKPSGSSTLRRVAIGTGIGLGAAAAGVGGKRLYDINQNQQQGYGN
tara:strand:- start:391 stop:915 length:525 start_codon:yes stop_codon:yes gene_type:complete